MRCRCLGWVLLGDLCNCYCWSTGVAKHAYSCQSQSFDPSQYWRMRPVQAKRRMCVCVCVRALCVILLHQFTVCIPSFLFLISTVIVFRHSCLLPIRQAHRLAAFKLNEIKSKKNEFNTHTPLLCDGFWQMSDVKILRAEQILYWLPFFLFSLGAHTI